MLMVQSGNNAITGDVNQAGEKNAHEIDGASLAFHASNVKSNDGRASCGAVSLSKTGSFKNHEFAKALLKRNKIGTVNLIRHAMINGKVTKDLVVTLKDAVVISFAPTFSKDSSSSSLTFTYEKIDIETFNPDGTSAGKVAHDVLQNITE